MFVSNGCASTEYSISVTAYSKSVIAYSRSVFRNRYFSSMWLTPTKELSTPLTGSLSLLSRQGEHCRDVHGMLKIQDPRIDSAINSRIHCIFANNKLTEPSTETRDVYASSKSSKSVEQENHNQDELQWMTGRTEDNVIKILRNHQDCEQTRFMKKQFQQEDGYTSRVKRVHRKNDSRPSSKLGSTFARKENHEREELSSITSASIAMSSTV